MTPTLAAVCARWLTGDAPGTRVSPEGVPA